MLVDALGFLSANDQNGVRLPVVKFLASQRASSIQILVTYFIVVRLVLINRISLQHCRPMDYDYAVQEPNAEQASSRRKLLGETDMCSYCGLLIGKQPRLQPLSSASRALRPGGSAFAAGGSGRALARPGALGGALVMPRKIWSGPVLPPPKFPGVAMVGICANKPTTTYGLIGTIG